MLRIPVSDFGAGYVVIVSLRNDRLFVGGDGWNSNSTRRQADGTESMSIIEIGQSRSKISF